MEKGTMGYILCHAVENMFNGCRTFFYFVLVSEFRYNCYYTPQFRFVDNV